MKSINKRTFAFLCMMLNLAVYAVNAQEGWDYPVKPGTEAWNMLQTEDERIAVLQVNNKI